MALPLVLMPAMLVALLTKTTKRPSGEKLAEELPAFAVVVAEPAAWLTRSTLPSTVS